METSLGEIAYNTFHNSDLSPVKGAYAPFNVLANEAQEVWEAVANSVKQASVSRIYTQLTPEVANDHVTYAIKQAVTALLSGFASLGQDMESETHVDVEIGDIKIPISVTLGSGKYASVLREVLESNGRDLIIGNITVPIDAEAAQG